MPATGIDAAIRELQREQERIQGVISALKSLRPGATSSRRKRRGVKRKLSQAARKKISMAAKKRWAKVRASKK